MASSRVNELDLLRFLAALAVVFFHYSFRGYAADAMSIMPYPLLTPASQYGYLGVQLFFMISGFVILMSTASGSPRAFIISRAVRLYPAFWACCTITFLATLAIGAPRYFASVEQYLVNMTMLGEFAGITPIDGAYWLLFVELRFYALIAIVLAIGKIHQAQILALFWLMASVLLEMHPVRILRYLLISDYSAYFIGGATCFLIWSKGVSGMRLSMVGLSWCLAVFQSIKDLPGMEHHYRTIFNIYIVAGIVTFFFAVMLLVALKSLGFFSRKRWLFIGGLTYPLYLLHQNIGFMVFNIAYPKVDENLLFWGVLIAALISAYCVHIFIEKPFSATMKSALNALFGARNAHVAEAE